MPGTDKYSTIIHGYGYTRSGTLSLPAGICLLTGQAVPCISATHKNSDFVHFPEMPDAKYPAGDKIRLVADSCFGPHIRRSQGIFEQCTGQVRVCAYPDTWIAAEPGGGLFQQNDKTDAE